MWVHSWLWMQHWGAAAYWHQAAFVLPCKMKSWTPLKWRQLCPNSIQHHHFARYYLCVTSCIPGSGDPWRLWSSHLVSSYQYTDSASRMFSASSSESWQALSSKRLSTPSMDIETSGASGSVRYVQRWLTSWPWFHGSSGSPPEPSSPLSTVSMPLLSLRYALWSNIVSIILLSTSSTPPTRRG